MSIVNSIFARKGLGKTADFDVLFIHSFCHTHEFVKQEKSHVCSAG